MESCCVISQNNDYGFHVIQTGLASLQSKITSDGRLCVSDLSQIYSQLLIAKVNSIRAANPNEHMKLLYLRLNHL